MPRTLRLAGIVQCRSSRRLCIPRPLLQRARPPQCGGAMCATHHRPPNSNSQCCPFHSQAKSSLPRPGDGGSRSVCQSVGWGRGAEVVWANKSGQPNAPRTSRGLCWTLTHRHDRRVDCCRGVSSEIEGGPCMALGGVPAGNGVPGSLLTKVGEALVRVPAGSQAPRSA